MPPLNAPTSSSSAPRIAVIGAGLAGLACAAALADHGLAVTVFDKGRSPGGRTTSRREPGERIFDHGAQFFTARGEWLLGRIASWEKAGVVARWAPRIRSASDSAPPPETWWVGAPRMGAVAAHLAVGLDVRLGATVSAVARRGDAWSLSFASASGGASPADVAAEALVLAVPATQCRSLLAPVSSLLEQLGPVVQTPCWAVMIALKGVDLLGADVLEDRASIIPWAAREDSKPGRTLSAGEDLWTLHASTEWSEAHLEDSPEDACAALVRAFVDAHRIDAACVVHAKAHRWRYARGRAESAPRGALFDAKHALAVCGDWLENARVESAIDSGLAASEKILAEARFLRRSSA